MLDKELEKEIVGFIQEESTRIGYGKVIFTVTVLASNIVNIKAETERSKELKQFMKKKCGDIHTVC